MKITKITLFASFFWCAHAHVEILKKDIITIECVNASTCRSKFQKIINQYKDNFNFTKAMKMPGLGFFIPNYNDKKKYPIFMGYIDTQSNAFSIEHTERQILKTLSIFSTHSNHPENAVQQARSTQKILNDPKEFPLYLRGAYYIYTPGNPCLLPTMDNHEKPCVKLYQEISKLNPNIQFYIYTKQPGLPFQIFLNDKSKIELLLRFVQSFSKKDKQVILQYFKKYLDNKGATKELKNTIRENCNILKCIMRNERISKNDMENLKINAQHHLTYLVKEISRFMNNDENKKRYSQQFLSLFRQLYGTNNIHYYFLDDTM